MDRKEMAVLLHDKGYNCAQSVACSFCNVFGADPETTFRLAEPFGKGMGNEEFCGAASGMGFVIGMKQSDGNLDEPATKQESYALMQRAVLKFRKEIGTTVCSEIKGTQTGEPLTTWVNCIETAVRIMDEMLLGL